MHLAYTFIQSNEWYWGEYEPKHSSAPISYYVLLFLTLLWTFCNVKAMHMQWFSVHQLHQIRAETVSWEGRPQKSEVSYKEITYYYFTHTHQQDLSSSSHLVPPAIRCCLRNNCYWHSLSKKQLINEHACKHEQYVSLLGWDILNNWTICWPMRCVKRTSILLIWCRAPQLLTHKHSSTKIRWSKPWFGKTQVPTPTELLGTNE